MEGYRTEEFIGGYECDGEILVRLYDGGEYACRQCALRGTVRECDTQRCHDPDDGFIVIRPSEVPDYLNP